MRLVVRFKLERYIFTYVDVLPSYVDLVGLAAAALVVQGQSGQVNASFSLKLWFVAVQWRYRSIYMLGKFV